MKPSASCLFALALPFFIGACATQQESLAATDSRGGIAGASSGAGSAASAGTPSCATAWAGLSPEQRDFSLFSGKKTTEAYERFLQALQRERCRKDWTVLVYMAADQNDLKPYAYLNLYEMESAQIANQRTAGSTEKTDVLVQLDTPGQRGLRRLHIFQAPEPYDKSLSKQYFESRSEEDLRSPVVKLLDEPAHETAADAARDLKDFLHWGISHYPARHYMVIVWGHGRGYAPAQSPTAAPDTELRGIAADMTQGTYLDTPLLRDTLQAVVREDLGGRPLDLYVSDACLMQSIEVTTELSGLSRFIVGSAQIQPFTGLPYRQLLHEMNSGRFALKDGRSFEKDGESDEAYLIAKMLPALTAAALRGDDLQARLSPAAKQTFTLSALRSRDLQVDLVPSLHEVGRLLSASIDAVPLRAVQLGVRIQRMPSFLGGATDVGFFLERIKDTALTSGWCRLSADSEEVAQCVDRPTTLLLEALTRAQQALSQTVISAAYGDEYRPTQNPTRMLGFSGLSVWLPRLGSDYQNRISDFSQSAFYQPSIATDPKTGPWSPWLARVFHPQ